MEDQKHMQTIQRFAILTILGLTLAALPASGRPSGQWSGMRQPSPTWVKRAPAAAVDLRQTASEAITDAVTPRPVVLLETNYYTFLPGEPLELRLTSDPNGFGGAVTMYLYREDRVSGERSYYNIQQGELEPGVQRDLFGSPGSPVPVFVPTLRDLVLFGSDSPSDLSWGEDGVLGDSIIVPAGETGLHQWVVELRDPAGRRVIARSNAAYSWVSGTVNVSGTITSSQTWTADKRYILTDYVGVAEPAVLTIEPGTIIYGGNGTATLFIQRGAKILAEGTERRPIVFTSPQLVGQRAQKDWGSLVLLGRAPINVPGGEALLEGLPSQPEYRYGGTDPLDDSGVLRFVRLEFGGYPIAQDQEINGLTLAGVGRNTTIDYIQVLHNKDDAFEFFGGNVNASHLLAVAMADDGLDFDFGYTGSVQFAAIIKRAENDEGDSNFLTESDNNGSGGSDTPQTNPTVYNVTAVRVPSGTGFYGARLRRNTGGQWHNVIVAGAKNAPVYIDGSSAQSNAASGILTFDHSILFGDFSAAAYPGVNGDPTVLHLFTTSQHNRNTDPMLAIGTPSLVKTWLPDLTPLEDSPALDAAFVGNPPDDGFLRPVAYQGAVGPGDNWILSGWANFSDN